VIFVNSKTLVTSAWNLYLTFGCIISCGKVVSFCVGLHCHSLLTSYQQGWNGIITTVSKHWSMMFTYLSQIQNYSMGRTVCKHTRCNKWATIFSRVWDEKWRDTNELSRCPPGCSTSPLILSHRAWAARIYNFVICWAEWVADTLNTMAVIHPFYSTGLGVCP
jgi:hypothetical protein